MNYLCSFCYPAGAITIDKAYEAANNTTITVVGQIQYCYGSKGNINTTIIEDVINIYHSVAYPESLGANDKANVYGVFSKYSSTYQLRNGKAEESIKKLSYEVDDSIQTSLAKWAGTAKFEGAIVYGDRYGDNDFLDTDAKITLSTGKAPQYSNTANGKTEYYIGSTGLGEYYQLELSTPKYAAVELDFKLRSSNAGAKFYNVLYSTDGVNFDKAEKISYTINTTTYVEGVAQNSYIWWLVL